MKLEQYLEEIKRTLPDLGNNFSNQLHMVIGLSTEAGELLDIFKKKFAYGKDIDYVHIVEEIFDNFWYLCNLCNILGINPEDGFQINIDKLKSRYPEKFTSDSAINRDLDAERFVLSQGLVDRTYLAKLLQQEKDWMDEPEMKTATGEGTITGFESGTE